MVLKDPPPPPSTQTVLLQAKGTITPQGLPTDPFYSISIYVSFLSWF